MTIKDYSSTAASNTAINGISIAGTAPVSNMDDGLRNVMADISNWTDSDTLASGTTTDLGSVQGMYVSISGTSTITSFGTLKSGMVRFLKFDAAATLTHNATSLILPGAANITAVAGDTATFVSLGSGNWRCLQYTRGDAAVRTAATGHLYGLSLSNNSTDSTNDIDIEAGECASDSTPAHLMVLASSLTKRLDAAWAVGTGNGGLDTGSIANGTYHIWLIQRSDTGVVDALFSTSATSPTMPANYDRKRRIGSIVRASGAIRDFRQIGDLFMYRTPLLSVNITNLGTTAVAYTVDVPADITLYAILGGLFSNAGANAILYVRAVDEANLAASTSGSYTVSNPVAATSIAWAKNIRITAASARQVAAVSSIASSSLTINTQGWVDHRGRL